MGYGTSGSTEDNPGDNTGGNITMTQSATVKIPGNVSLNGGELQNAKLQSLVSKDAATEADFWYDSVNHKPVYHNGTTVKDFGKEYAAGLNVSIENGTISATDTTYTFSTGLTTTEGNIVSVSDYNKLVKNIASNAESIEIGGSSTNKTEAVSLGKDSSAGAGCSTAIGYKAEASGLSSTALGHKAKVTSGSNAIAIGNNAVASAVDAIQIGKGTISTQKTLSIGFGDSNYALLNGNTGKIPDERLSTAIARTTDIGNGVTVFKKNGTAFATTTANQTSAVNVDYTVPTTVAELSDSSNYALKSDVASAIIPKGSISAVSGLPTLAADHRGWMYNFDTAFTTTSDFVEGSGKKYPAGTNVVVVEYSSGTYKYDIFSGFVDTTTYDSHVANTTIHVTSTEKSTWNSKQDALTAGSNITISGGTISATDTTYSAGSNIQINNGTISATDTTYTFSTGLTNTSGTVTANIQTSIRPSTTASDTTMPSEKAVAKELLSKKNVYLGMVNSNWEESEDPIIPVTVANATYSEDNGNHLIVNFGNKVNMTSTPKIKVNGGTARDVYVNGVNSGIYNILKGNVEFVFYNNAFYATTASPTVGNGKVIYQKNGTAFSTINVNQTSTTTVNYTIPTAVSDLSDASDYAKKYTTVNPALTSSNGVVTWTITNNATTADVDVSIYEVGSTSNTKIYPAIDVNASNIIMTMLSSSNISAGALKAVTVG